MFPYTACVWKWKESPNAPCLQTSRNFFFVMSAQFGALSRYSIGEWKQVSNWRMIQGHYVWLLPNILEIECNKRNWATEVLHNLSIQSKIYVLNHSRVFRIKLRLQFNTASMNSVPSEFLEDQIQVCSKMLSRFSFDLVPDGSSQQCWIPPRKSQQSKSVRSTVLQILFNVSNRDSILAAKKRWTCFTD